MSSGSFNTVYSPYTFDHQAAWNRLKADEKRKEIELQTRVAGWAIGKLAGESFDSLPALRARLVGLAEHEFGELTETQYRALHFAGTHLWAGMVEANITLGRLKITDEPRSVRFVA